MIRFFFFISVILFQGLLLYSQDDSIYLEIKNYPDSKLETIIKARSLIEDKLELNDFEKISQVMNYVVNQVEDSNYVAFELFEYWMLLHATQEYDELLKNVSNYTIESHFSLRHYSSNFDDQLFEKLQTKFREQIDGTFANIENSQRNAEEKNFLKLHVLYCLSKIDIVLFPQDSLNQKSDEFVMNYPFSIYVPFVKMIIRYREKTSNFAFGYNMCLGYGPLSGNLAQSMDNFGVFGLGINIYYKSFVFDFSFLGAASKLKKDIQLQSLVWNKDINASLLIPQISIGYQFFGKYNFNITPSFGINMMHIVPIYDENYGQYLENVNFDSDIAWCAGIGLNLFSPSGPNIHLLRNSVKFQIFAQIKYVYTDYKFNQNGDDFNGAFHQICLTVGALSRKVKRIY